MTLRIMHLISGMTTNGAVLQCLAVVQSLARRGHDVTLVCRPGAWIGDQLAGGPVEVVHSEQRRWPLHDLRGIGQVARERRIQLLHTHQSRAHLFGVLLKWRTRIPCVATAHARHVQPHWVFNDFVIANSQATFEFQRRWNWVSRRRMEVVHYLLSLGPAAPLSPEMRVGLRREWGLTDSDLLVGVVGDVIPRKAQHDLVVAWSEVRRRVPHARLVIVGAEKDPVYAAKVRREIERENLADSIRWTGYRTDMPAVMFCLDLCVSAAREEALGLTIPEAMAARLPVVATRVGGVPENVWQDETGLLVPPGKPAAMAQAIIELLLDPDRRRRFGELGRTRVLEKYNSDRQMDQLEAIYRRLVRDATG